MNFTTFVPSFVVRRLFPFASSLRVRLETRTRHVINNCLFSFYTLLDAFFSCTTRREEANLEEVESILLSIPKKSAMCTVTVVAGFLHASAFSSRCHTSNHLIFMLCISSWNKTKNLFRFGLLHLSSPLRFIKQLFSSRRRMKPNSRWITSLGAHDVDLLKTARSEEEDFVYDQTNFSGERDKKIFSGDLSLDVICWGLSARSLPLCFVQVPTLEHRSHLL